MNDLQILNIMKKRSITKLILYAINIVFSIISTIITISVFAAGALNSINSDSETAMVIFGGANMAVFLVFLFIQIGIGIATFVYWVLNIISATKLSPTLSDRTLLIIFAVFDFMFVDLIFITSAINRMNASNQNFGQNNNQFGNNNNFQPK